MPHQKYNNISSMLNMRFHHIGLLVDDINHSIINYSSLFGVQNISEIFTINSQKVRICFVKIGTNEFIELVEPIGDDSVVSKLLKKRISYYHLAYKVTNIKESINILEEKNYKALEVFKSEAFDNKYCVFLYTPDGHLIELIEE